MIQKDLDFNVKLQSCCWSLTQLTLLMGMAGKVFGCGLFAVTYPVSPLLYTLSEGPGEFAWGKPL